MRATIRGRNLSVTEADRTYVERKLQRLERLLDDGADALVELRIEGNRKSGDSHVVEVSLAIDGRSLHGNASAATFKAATDIVVDRLERRVVEQKQRPRDRARAEQARYGAVIPPEAQPAAASDEPLIVKVKRFAIEPMFEEDAISRMEELGHTFFIFVNAESERVAVLYRRRDGRYGLIEPAIGGAYATDG